MFRVFISASSLEKICLNEMNKDIHIQNPWFLLLSKQNVIYLDKNIYEEWDYGDPLFTFSESYGIQFMPSQMDFNSIVKDSPQSVLMNPQGAFLLDIDKNLANSIQKDYGVICHSTSDLENCELFTVESKLTLIKNENVHSWHELFNDGSKIPSNSLIIIDRYLFGYEDKYKTNYYDGINNIKRIIKSILPTTLKCDYHILILFDASNSDRNFKFDKVGKMLEEFKNKELNKPYNISIELFSVTFRCANYDDTHNRKILSNYFIGSAEHLLKAFKKDGEAVCRQDLRLEYSYSHGITDRSDSATKYMNDLLFNISEIYNSGKKEFAECGEKAQDYQVLLNDDESLTINDLKNRLITM